MAIERKSRKHLGLEPAGRLLALGPLFATVVCAHALTISSEPSLTPSTLAPLAAVLQLTSDVACRVSVAVDDGVGAWERNFFDYGTAHSVPLLGFKPNRTNQITVTVRDKNRNQFTLPYRLTFKTSPLPDDFPPMTLRSAKPGKMEPGYTLFKVQNRGRGAGYVTIVDQQGEVVWYGQLPTSLQVRPLPNGNLFLPTSDSEGFAEFNLLGDMVKTWTAPTHLPVDMHEDLLTGHGTILYINNAQQVVTNFPTSSTDPNAPRAVTTVECNKIVEISTATSALLNSWSLLDMLDPTRIDYLTFLIPMYGVDAQHANSVIEDPRDDSIIVSLRNQDAVVKFSRQTGKLKWILGPHENWGSEWQPYLLNPVGPSFQWQYGQHAPMITPQGTLLLFDNGNLRAEPFAPPVADTANYSRAVEYFINEATMQVSQVWDYGRTNSDRIYTDRVGSAFMLPETENVLITFGYVLYEDGALPSSIAPNATPVRIQEVTHEENPEVVFDLEVFDSNNTAPNYAGCIAYRSYRMPDLYPHPAAGVTAITIRSQAGVPIVEFSADPARSYRIEASRDLVNWYPLGMASQSRASGNFYFSDEISDEKSDASSRLFYRVVTL